MSSTKSLGSVSSKKTKACKGRKRPSCKRAKPDGRCSWVNRQTRGYCRRTAKRGRSSKSN